MSTTDLLVWGTVAHLVADWFLQNDWQAVNKSNPRHVAGYVHAFAHVGCLAFVFPLPVAWLLGLSHWFIDLRTPLIWYRDGMRQALPGNPFADHVKIWQDQVAHVLFIAVAAYAVAG